MQIRNQGEIIKEIRHEFQLTQKELAKKVGANKNDIWRYENNLHAMSFPTFLKWCKILQISDINKYIMLKEATYL